MKNEEVEKKIYDIIYNQLNHNMLSHAYLVETNDYDDIKSLMMKIVKCILCCDNGNHIQSENCNTCNLIDTNQLIDLKQIYPQGNMIKKEQLLELKQLFKTTSLSKYRVYVIYEAEKLNPSAANTILKFLEEPEEGIVAFLVTKNRYHILETLVSRCQILNVHSTPFIKYDLKLVDFFQKITKGEDFYLEFKEIMEEYMPDKNAAKVMIDQLELYLHQLLLSRTNTSIQVQGIELFENMSKNSIISYISILEEEKEKLLYNINYRLWFNHFMVRFLEVVEC